MGIQISKQSKLVYRNGDVKSKINWVTINRETFFSRLFDEKVSFVKYFCGFLKND